MTDTVFSVDTVSGACALKELTQYPVVTSPDGSITVTPIVDANGKTTYQVRVTHDVNMDVAGFDPIAMTITMKETNGDTFTIDLSTLASTVTNTVSGNAIATHKSGTGQIITINETVTSLAVSGAGFMFTDESGGSSVISLCSMMNNVAHSATKIGG